MKRHQTVHQFGEAVEEDGCLRATLRTDNVHRFCYPVHNLMEEK